MNISMFTPCNPTHRQNFQYCCFMSSRVFCQVCWFSQSHYLSCKSSRCGNFEKIAHKVIGTTLQMKTMQSLAQMCSNFETFDQFYRKILGYSHMMTRKLTTEIQSKLPLFIWNSFSDMLASKCSKLKQMTFDDAAGFDMIKIIKGKQQSKAKQLEQVIKSISQVMHQYDGLHNRLKQKKYEGNLNMQVQKIISFCTERSSILVSNLTTSIKKHMESQYGKLLKQFDASINFEGVKFANRRNFNNLQCYNHGSIYSSINQKNNSGCNFYHGIPLTIQKLQETPEMLLQVSKSMLKQKIFRIHSQIKQMKSSFPYKYAYVMCTTLQSDPDYQFTVLSLQKNYIKQFQKKSQSCFLNSVSLIIMGPQLIIIQFKNYPKKIANIQIYGYNSARDKHCDKIIETLGVCRDAKQKKIQKVINKVTFQTKLKPVELAYVQFQLAYEHLFTKKQRISDEFEGEKYVLGRGVKLLEGIIKNWEDKASIQFQIDKKEEQYMPLFI